MKLITPYLLALLITGCAMDYTATSQIMNSTLQPIRVSVTYDREKLDQVYHQDKNEYLRYLSSQNESTGLQPTFDSVSLTSYFVVPVNKALVISHTPGGDGVTPDYSIVKQITAESTQGTRVYHHESLDTAFHKLNRAIWELTIR